MKSREVEENYDLERLFPAGCSQPGQPRGRADDPLLEVISDDGDVVVVVGAENGNVDESG